MDFVIEGSRERLAELMSRFRAVPDDKGTLVRPLKVDVDMFLDDKGEGEPDAPWFPDLVELVLRRFGMEWERWSLQPQDCPIDSTTDLQPAGYAELFQLAHRDQGDRQDSAPDGVGSDDRSASRDFKIHVNAKCWDCHTPQVLLRFDPWFRDLKAHGHPLQSPDRDIAKELRQAYDRDIVGPMDDDNCVMARAIFQTTQWTPAKWATEYVGYFNAYEAPVDGAWAADLGLTEAEFTRRILAYKAKTGALRPTLAGLISGKRVGIRQWESLYPEAQLAVRGLAAVQPVQRKGG